MSEKTGADQYFAERMKDPEYAKHYYEATISEQAAEIERLERLRDSLLESCSKYEAMKVGWRAALNQKETPNGNH